MKCILVLEDTYERIEWLRATVAGRARVVWARGVRAFQKLYHVCDTSITLVILDHDLGLSCVRERPATEGHLPGTEGPRGLTGLDAADWLAENKCKVPVIVWSFNPDGSKFMLSSLRKAGVEAWQATMLFPENLRADLDAVLGR